MSADEEKAKPTFDSVKSGRDREATFKDATTEVDRILRLQANFYAVLKVTREAEDSTIKKNYYKLSRLIHPDKTSVEKAGEAFKIVSLAYSTLTNPIKRKLYDQYTRDVDVNAPPEDTQSYAEWEAEQMRNPVKIPGWLEKALKVPVLGFVLAIILLPLLLIVIVVAVLLALFLLMGAWIMSLLLCIPFRICCCPDTLVKAEDVEEEDAPPSADENV